MTAKEHNKLLSIFHFVQGGLQALGGILVGLIYGGIGIGFLVNARRSEEQAIATMFVVLALIIAPLILIFAAINLTAAYKMLKEKPSARTWGIVASILCLPGIPLGTALGIYGLWFLFGEEGKRFYLGAREPQYFNPPPPTAWQ